MRENALLSPHRRPQGEPIALDSSIQTDRPNDMWGTDRIRIEPHYPRTGNGRPPIRLERMLRMYFLANWFNFEVPSDLTRPRRGRASVWNPGASARPADRVWRQWSARTVSSARSRQFC